MPFCLTKGPTPGASLLMTVQPWTGHGISKSALKENIVKFVKQLYSYVGACRSQLSVKYKVWGFATNVITNLVSHRRWSLHMHLNFETYNRITRITNKYEVVLGSSMCSTEVIEKTYKFQIIVLKPKELKETFENFIFS